jgi:hypothetical protein
MNYNLVQGASDIARKCRWQPGVDKFRVDLGAGFLVGFKRPEGDSESDRDSDSERRPPEFPPIELSMPTGTTTYKLSDALKYVATMSIDWATADSIRDELAVQILDLYSTYKTSVSANLPQSILLQQPEHFVFKVRAPVSLCFHSLSVCQAWCAETHSISTASR